MTHYANCACYECHKSRSRRDRMLRVAIIALCVGVLAVVGFCLAGCSSTVTPSVVASHQASFDEGYQNSGVIAMLPGNAGAVITPHARDRYNALVAIYGREFLPPLAADVGIFHRNDGTYDINAEALQKFILMNTWHRMGREPKTK